MSEPQQQPNEPVAATGNDFVEVDGVRFPPAAPSSEPVSETPAPIAAEPVPENQDYTFNTLENGQREMRLATGQVYRGKDDSEVMRELAKAQLEASRHITTLNARIKETPAQAPAPQPPAPELDATSVAIADLMAPRFGFKNSEEMANALASIQTTAQQQREYMEAQASKIEAANFFLAVPEFSKSKDDADKIDQFLQSNAIPFNARTAEMAYYTLKAKGEFGASVTSRPGTAPKNNMPSPPVGSSPASTGKGTITDADLYSMTTEQLYDLIAASSA